MTEIGHTTVQCLRESPPAQQTQDICITFIQCPLSDVGPTLHKVIQMFCVYAAVNEFPHNPHRGYVGDLLFGCPKNTKVPTTRGTFYVKTP